jgi:hypothetical protein
MSGVNHAGNATDMLEGVFFAPGNLAQCRRCSKDCRFVEGELEAGDCSAAIVFDFSSDEENGLSSKRRLFGVMAGDVLSSL